MIDEITILIHTEKITDLRFLLIVLYQSVPKASKSEYTNKYKAKKHMIDALTIWAHFIKEYRNKVFADSFVSVSSKGIEIRIHEREKKHMIDEITIL